MAKKIRQFRFYGDGSNQNYPSQIVVNNTVRDVTYFDYYTGNVFANYYPIVQLGIQSLPGTKFFLNSSQEPIIIGYTGIYELDLEGSIEITKINFDYNSVQLINDLNDGILLVDVIYEDGTAEE